MTEHAHLTGMIGLLWYEPGDSAWQTRMQAAIERHIERFGGLRPTVCHINPLMANPNEIVLGGPPQFLERVAGVEVFLNVAIQPDHFFVARRPAARPPAAPPPEATQLGFDLGGG